MAIEIPIQELKEIVHYDPETGIMKWAKLLNARAPIGKECGRTMTRGYRAFIVRRKTIYTHRAAWAYVNGSWPKNTIDHINGNKSDNRISNLREATSGENNRNSKTPKSNTSGVKGVSWNSKHQRWRARVGINKKDIHVGEFLTIQQAENAIIEMRKTLHGEFARHA